MTEPEKKELVQIIKLSQNENAYGASPKALKAIEDYYREVFRYPDVFHKELKQKLAGKCGVEPENIVVSAGSIALMDMSIKAFVGFDENMVTAEVTFEGYKYMAKVNGRSFKLAKLVNNAISMNSMLAACDDKTGVVFVANPNNPTGTMVNHQDMERFLHSLPSNTYVVSDEAYAEYVTDTDYPDTHTLQKTCRNLIIFRTFSKIYGLAGLRIGYAIAHREVIRSLEQVKTPFSISSLASVAALAALDDTEYVHKCAAANAAERVRLYNDLIDMGFKAVYPHGNFVYVTFNEMEEKERFFNILEDRSVQVRKLERFGIDLALRITVGRPEDNRFLIECLRDLHGWDP